MIAGAIALSLVMLLLVLFYYQQPKTLEEQEADDRLVALQKGITLEQLIEKRAKKKARRIPKELRHKVYARDEYRCQQCASTTNLTLDHIFPFSKGGSNTLDNLRVLCHPCNQKKANHG